MSHKFAPGDTVVLKSGSPIMTVTSVGNSKVAGDVAVVWFDPVPGGKQHRDTFHSEALRLHEAAV